MKALGLLVVVCTSAVAHADLFSPGELSKAHATLNGLSQCTKCHPAGQQLSQAACLSCHEELQPRLNKGLGLHGRISSDKRNCEQCHREHQGETAPLINWGNEGEAGFNHQRSGWPLKGGHTKVKCKTCHEKRLMVWPTALDLLKKRPATRLGLSTGCAECHFDEHRGQLKEDCDYCHTEKAWDPAPGFSHDSTEYPLRGRHQKVKCRECHESETDPETHGFPAPRSDIFMRFSPVAHRTCLDCHQDPHENRFGGRCQSCHTLDGWKVIRPTFKEREFHEKTKFPLKGAHLEVDCKSCHGPFPGQAAKFKGLAFEICSSCHFDAHVGQLAQTNGKSPDCENCHTEQGFTPTKFGIAEHARTRYPLDGAHQVVPCSACHPATPALRARLGKPLLMSLQKKKRDILFSSALLDFDKPINRCESCHSDEHRGQFKDKACDSCHRQTSFTDLRFDHQRDSKYPLEGGHQKVKCSQCHVASTAQAAVVYKPLKTTCQSCHRDVHLGLLSRDTCESCHRTTRWQELLFEHRPPFTEFVLDGQHQTAKCEACHRNVTLAPKVTAVQYRPLPTSCEGCHHDFHEGAFRGFEP